MRARISKILVDALLSVTGAGLVLPSQADADITSRGLILRLDSKNPASFTPGTSTWRDISGNNHVVTLYNSTNVAPETIAANTRAPAMQFYNTSNALTGKHGAVDTGTTINWGAFPGLTFTFTANWGTTSGVWDRIIDFGNNSASDNILLARNNATNDISIEIFNGTSSYGYCTFPSGITNNTWAHYAVVFNGSTCTYFKNNSKQTPNNYTGLPSNVGRTKNYIARSNWSSDSLFSGGIADFAMYNVALTDTEVAQNFTEQTASQMITFTSTAPTNAISGISNYAVVDTVTSQLPITNTIDATSISVCSISNGTVTFLTGGTCKINANQPGNANYSAATQVQQSFSITANSTLQFSVAGNATSATYRQSLGLTATVSPTGKVTFYQQGKAIPGCKGLSGSGTITCNWKPAQKSAVSLTVSFLPSNIQLTTRTAGPIVVNVVGRLTKR